MTTLADDVLCLVHAFSDEGRREAVRVLAKRVADIEALLAESQKPVHLVSFAGHTSVQLLCTGEHREHSWGVDGHPIREASPLGGGIYPLEGGLRFTHSDPCATCAACIEKRFEEVTQAHEARRR